MQLGIINFEVFLLGTIFIVLLPGPNSLFVLTTSANHGMRAGFIASCGIFIGDALLMFASVIGVSSLMHSFPVLFTGLKLLGAIYLMWIGFNLLVAGLTKINALINNNYLNLLIKIVNQIKKIFIFNKNSNDKKFSLKVNNDFAMALALSLSNPKGILFFIAFFVQFVEVNATNLGLSFLVLGLVVELISAIYLTILIISGTYLASWFIRKKYLSAICICLAGLMFMGFAVQLSIANL